MYPRETYIVREDRDIPKREARIYIIQDGECLVVFSGEYQDLVISPYEIKKKQRDAMFGSRKVGNGPKLEKFKAENIYCVQNVTIKRNVTKAAVQSFSRVIQRDLTFNDQQSPKNATLLKIASPKSQE